MLVILLKCILMWMAMGEAQLIYKAANFQPKEKFNTMVHLEEKAALDQSNLI